MRDIGLDEIISRMRVRGETFVLFVYTPWCGTCAVAMRMLQVIGELLPTLPLYRANLNEMPSLAQAWRIESVPCVVVVQSGQLVSKTYAMRSVEDLYRLLQPLTACGERMSDTNRVDGKENGHE